MPEHTGPDRDWLAYAEAQLERMIGTDHDWSEVTSLAIQVGVGYELRRIGNMLNTISVMASPARSTGPSW